MLGIRPLIGEQAVIPEKPKFKKKKRTRVAGAPPPYLVLGNFHSLIT